MPTEIEEAKGLLIKAINTMPHIEHKQDDSDVYCLVSNALAKLRSIKAPEPTEFTRLWGIHLDNCDTGNYPAATRINMAETGLRKACGIIDQFQAENKAVLRRAESAEEDLKVTEERIEKLIAGQQAKLIAGSGGKEFNG